MSDTVVGPSGDLTADGGGRSMIEGKMQASNMEGSSCLTSAGCNASSNSCSYPQPSASQYTHPVYGSISRANGVINRMKVDELREKLTGLKLSTRGSKEVLQKRLKTWVKENKLSSAKIPEYRSEKIDYYVVIDIEATCEEDQPDYVHEVIEFPALLLNSDTLEVESEFRTYCRPTVNPKLSKFCVELTGISQHKVDCAPTFKVALDRFNTWLYQNLSENQTFAVATDGPWDVNRFIRDQCQILDLNLPYYFHRWVNIRKHFNNFYKLKNLNVEQMLEHLGMTFQGRPHCGMDDTRNISRILIQLIKDGCDVKINCTLRKDFK